MESVRPEVAPMLTDMDLKDLTAKWANLLGPTCQRAKPFNVPLHSPPQQGATKN
jgi:hypothetical protein